MKKIWIQKCRHYVGSTKMFKCFENLLSNARWIWIVFQFVSGFLRKNRRSTIVRWREKKVFARIDGSWFVSRNSKHIDKNYWRNNGSKKKDEFQYKFDRYTATGKIEADGEFLEILFIDKYKRTHEQFMNTPKRIIDWLLIKRSSEAKAQKKKSTFRYKK